MVEIQAALSLAFHAQHMTPPETTSRPRVDDLAAVEKKRLRLAAETKPLLASAPSTRYLPTTTAEEGTP